MTVSESGLYAAFAANDARFDGRFFVGISSTGIYCRPVCRARRAKAANCSFFASAAEAEQAGYRPCLLCRPELAPGESVVEASGNLARRAARLLRENCGKIEGLEEVARRLGCSDRHLRRVFAEEFHVAPVQYLQTCRLLLAKGLLTDTDLPVVDVAMAAGFGSLRRFNTVFQDRYRLSPTALRKRLPERAAGSGITVRLGYRPPYRWEEMLDFLSVRAIAGVEVVRDGEYLRTVRIARDKSAGAGAVRGVLGSATAPSFGVPSSVATGWVKVGHLPSHNALQVTISESLLPVLPQVLGRIRQLFDLACDPDAVYETLEQMNDLRPGLAVLGTRVPGCFDVFEMAVRAVLGQQVTVKAAGRLAGRIVREFGTPVDTEIEGLTHLFPSAGDIAVMAESIQDSFGVLGVTSARSRTIGELARLLVEGAINFDVPARPEDEIAQLEEIRGIGPWTAQYIAMRAMEWPDSFLETDAGVKKALPGYNSKELVELAEAWHPWRSYATVNLWNSLSRLS